jgi:hypothetical protein
MRTKSALVLVLGCGVCALAGQAAEPPEPPAAPSAPDAPDAPEPGSLAGPRLDAGDFAPSLVSFGYDGRLKRLETTPEEAATDLLDLPPSAREAIEQVIAERAAILDRIVVNNIPELLEIFSSFQGGDAATGIRKYLRFSRELRPLNARGSLQEEIAGVLPDELRARFDAIVNEYRSALVEDIRAEAESKGEKIGRRQAALREGLAAIGQEIGRSVERQIGNGALQLQRLYEHVEATAEQQAAIGAKVQEFLGETQGAPTRMQSVRLFFDILRVLTPEQRKHLLNSIRKGELSLE